MGYRETMIADALALEDVPAAERERRAAELAAMDDERLGETLGALWRAEPRPEPVPPGLRVVLIGPPASGKGTQARRIAEADGLHHLSTGDMLRREVAERSPVGLRIERAMTTGELIGDDIVLEVVAGRLTPEVVHRGFVLDGFPRTVAQAEGLDDILSRLGGSIDVVIGLEVGEDALRARMAARAAADAAAGRPVRPDDDPAVFEERLAVYVRETRPVLDFYASVIPPGYDLVDGNAPADRVAERIDELLDRAAKYADEQRARDLAALGRIIAVGAQADDPAVVGGNAPGERMAADRKMVSLRAAVVAVLASSGISFAAGFYGARLAMKLWGMP